MSPELENSLGLADFFEACQAAAAVTVPDAIEGMEELDEPLPELVRLLEQLREAIVALKRAESEIERVVIARVPFGGCTLDGIGTVEVRGGSARKGYDQALLVSAYASRLARQASMEYLGTDEPPEQLAKAIEYAVQTMAKATGALAPSFTSWRTGTAKELGIDLNRYAAEREPSAKTVIVRSSTLPKETP